MIAKLVWTWLTEEPKPPTPAEKLAKAAWETWETTVQASELALTVLPEEPTPWSAT